MKIKDELWLQNSGTSDVHLSDLGVKVPATQTINVFKWNPYLTVAKVQQSYDTGSLAKRLSSKTLKVVKRKPKPSKSVALEKVKASKEAVLIKKTKSSIIVESNSPELDESEEFSFADYGVTDVGPDVSRVNEKGSVFVSATQDDDPQEESDATAEPRVENTLSKQSSVVMETQMKMATNPIGKIAEASEPSLKQPFTVVKPPKDDEVVDEAKVPDIKPVKEGNMVTTNVGKMAGQRSLKTIQALNEMAKGMGLADASDLPPSLVEAYEAEQAIELETTEFDTKVATKTESGATVMKLKEVDGSESQ